MKRVLTIAAAALMASSLAACKDQNSPTADPTLSASSRVATPPSSSAPPSTQATTTAVAAKATTTLDPCKLVTREEASAMAHASFGPGKEQGPSTAPECIYGAQTKNVLTVVAAAAPSADSAKAHWNQLLTEAQQGLSAAPAGSVKLTPQSGVGDRAEWVEADLSAIHVSARGLAFLNGNVGVYMIDLVLDGTAPSRPAMTDQANTVLDRLP
jgi:hypothetical protein